MKRFSPEGIRIMSVDLSPLERQWVRALQELTVAVIDCRCCLRHAIEVLALEMRTVAGCQLDLDQLRDVRQSRLLNPDDFVVATSSPVGDECHFWKGMSQLAEEVLSGQRDLLSLFEAVGHDAAEIWNHDGYYWRAWATGWRPKCARTQLVS